MRVARSKIRKVTKKELGKTKRFVVKPKIRLKIGRLKKLLKPTAGEKAEMQEMFSWLKSSGPSHIRWGKALLINKAA